MEEIGTVPTSFNGIPGVDLVLLEKGFKGIQELEERAVSYIRETRDMIFCSRSGVRKRNRSWFV